jgi:hypothetical protein
MLGLVLGVLSPERGIRKKCGKKNILLDGLDTDGGLVGEEDKHLICGIILLLDHEHQSIAAIIKDRVARKSSVVMRR